MDIKLPKAVEYIIDTLEKAGYEGFAVGGCVRDCLIYSVKGAFSTAGFCSAEWQCC